MAKITFTVNMRSGKTELVMDEVVTNCSAIHDMISGDLAEALSLKAVQSKRGDDERPLFYEQSKTVGASW